MAKSEEIDGESSEALIMKFHNLLVHEDLSGAVALVPKFFQLHGHDGQNPWKLKLLHKFGANDIEFIMQLAKNVALRCGIDNLHDRLKSGEWKVGPFECLKCSGVLTVPVTVSCGHTFCKTCLSSTKAFETCCNCGQKSYFPVKSTNIMIQTIIEKLCPKEVEAMKFRMHGNTLLSGGEFDKAYEMYSSAIAIDPSDHRLFGNRAHTNLLLHKNRDSLNDAEKAIDLCYQWPKGHLRKCNALYALGENISALQELLICIYFYKSIPSVMESKLSHLMGSLNVVFECFAKHDGAGVAFDRIVDDIIMKDLVPLQMNHFNMKANESIDVTKLEPKDIECTICFRSLYEPVTVPCGHIFCKQCINRNLDYRPSCPLCKANLENYLSETLFKQQNITKLVAQFLETFYPSETTERKQAAEDERDTLNRHRKTKTLKALRATPL